MAVKGKFKSAYLKSSLFKELDRELLYQEQKQIWDNAKFEYFRYFSAMPNFNGKYISTDEKGFRKTIQYTKDEDLPVKNVAVFGTSTMWGGPSGSDEFTVPSFLAKRLNELTNDVNYVVNNYAVGAYTSTQEMILFIELLERNDIDIAIFVDGASEFLRSYEELYAIDNNYNFLRPAISYVRFSIYNSILLPRYLNYIIKLKKSDYGRKLKEYGYNIRAIIKRLRNNHKNSDISRNDLFEKQIDRTIKLYAKNKRVIEAIAREYGVKTIFALEPWIFTKCKLSQEENQILETIDQNELYSNFVKSCIQKFKIYFSNQKNCYDLTSIFTTDATVFIDEHHTSKNGNKIIANEMTKIIINKL